MIQYNMVQIPQGVLVDEKKHRGNEAAQFLQETVNKYAQDDWEFYRVDELSVATKVGCWGSLWGRKGEFNTYSVITFRRKYQS